MQDRSYCGRPDDRSAWFVAGAAAVALRDVAACRDGADRRLAWAVNGICSAPSIVATAESSCVLSEPKYSARSLGPIDSVEDAAIRKPLNVVVIWCARREVAGRSM